MKLKNKEVSENTRKFSISTVLYVAAAVVAIAGITLLVDNIFIFKSTVSQYVNQGFPASAVVKSLIPVQLLPGILEPIALYGGIAFVLLGIGIANMKISKYLTNLTEVEGHNDTVEEILLEQNDAEENTDIIEPTEIIEPAEIMEENKD